MIKKNSISYIPYILIILFFLNLCIFVTANPIPVFPDPKPTFQSQEIRSITESNFQIWIILVFLLDFACNILILYSALFILSTIKTINPIELSDFSRSIFLLSVLLISIIGILIEWLIGFWIIGLIFVCFIVFVSYIIVSKYLLKIDSKNSTYIGFYAIIINLIIWLIIFSI